MKKITFDKLKMSYFKGIKSLELSFDEGVNIISGDNGLGKTTIADAFIWCLFGKNYEGDTRFAIKTHDSEGNIIPDVEHSVELTLSIDGAQHTIKRVWVETRKVVRGKETGEIDHHSEFFVNGERYTKTDFDAWRSAIVSEQVFRAVTSTTYFVSLSWQQQRELLQTLVGDIDYTIINGRSEYKDVLARIEAFGDIEAYLKHVTYNIKQCKDALAPIPARIDEQMRVCPSVSVEDKDVVKQEIEAIKGTIKAKQEELANLTAGNESAAIVALRKRLDFEERRLTEMTTSANNQAIELHKQHSEKVTQLQEKVHTLSREKQDLQHKKQSQETLLTRVRERLQEIEEDTTKFRKRWNETQNLTFTFNESDMCCPVCGRMYVREDLERRNKEAKEHFNADRADKIEKLRKEAETLKREKAEAEAEEKTYADFLKTLDLTKIDENLTIAVNELRKVEEEKIENADNILHANPSYTEVKNKIEELKRQMQSEQKIDNSQLIEGLKDTIISEQSALDEKENTFRDIQLKEQCDKRIKELREQEETLREQYDNLLKQKDMADEYVNECNTLLESKVNQLFTITRFRLFQTLNDGTRKADCVATCEGTAYSDLNSAKKINVGLDILNAIAKYYDIVAPIIIDNCETVNNIMSTAGQQIRLRVTKDTKLVQETITL